MKFSNISDKYIININNEIATMADCFNLTVDEIQTEFQIKRISKKKKIFNYERRSYCYQCYT
jgi:hypothetical protein